MLGFEPIVEGGSAWILFSLMLVGIFVVLALTIPK